MNYIDLNEIFNFDVSIDEIVPYIETDDLMQELSNRISSDKTILDDFVNWFLDDSELKYLNKLISKKLSKDELVN